MCIRDRFTPSRRGWLHTPAKLAGFAWARLHGSAHYIHRIEAWARQKDYEKCRYVGCTVWDTNWNIVFLREDLEKTLYVPFEDAEFPIPAEYDRILRHTYGDYMTPPPPEQRIGQHFYTVWPVSYTHRCWLPTRAAGLSGPWWTPSWRRTWGVGG